MRKISWLSAFALVVGLLWAVPASAYAPPGGALFNVPAPWGSDTARFRLVRHVERAINETRPTAADPRPVILISTFLLDRTQSVDAMIGACRRGVSVRVILDEDIISASSKRLITMLNADNVRDDNGDGVADAPPKAGRATASRPRAPAPPAAPSAAHQRAGAAQRERPDGGLGDLGPRPQLRQEAATAAAGAPAATCTASSSSSPRRARPRTS